MINKIIDENMTEMSPLVRAYFKAAGWFEGRDVSGNFKFPEGKFVSNKALDLMKQYAYLKIAYRCCGGDGFIYFDNDDSQASKTLRRDFNKLFFKYLPDDTPDDEIYNKDKYNLSWEIEDLEKTHQAIEKAGVKLTRIGIFTDYTDAEIYIDEAGGVWIDGYKNTHDNLIEFCNCIMTGEKPYQEIFKSWYSRGLSK